MGARYLTDLAHVVRGLGLQVVEVGAAPGQTGTAWMSRARRSGGYDAGRPNHLMVHHTASSPRASGWADANYCTFVSPNRPVTNLLLARDAVVYVCAAGSTNTNGTGVDPCGLTAPDSMNRDALSIEASNNGAGEPWPQVQTDAYLVLVRGLCARYAIRHAQVHAHEEYAPNRKIDPAGPPRWIDPPDRPGTQIWNMGAFRADLDRGSAPPPTPPLPPNPRDWWTPLMARLPVLRRGAMGPPVRRMQHLLAAAGVMDPGNVRNYDGAFGAGTASALNRFKASAGGAPDGTCDAWTWGALMHTIDGIPDLRKGNAGPDVERMQHLLAAAGFLEAGNTANYDGVWGAGTERAKVRYDNSRGLTPSPPSDCGRRSWTALLTT